MAMMTAAQIVRIMLWPADYNELGGSDWAMLYHAQTMLNINVLAQFSSYKLAECHACILNLFTAFLLRLDAVP